MRLPSSFRRNKQKSVTCLLVKGRKQREGKKGETERVIKKTLETIMKCL